jgi:pyruvate dehydrogenase E2 component (dihydrolipoamide acetyltransferase)
MDVLMPQLGETVAEGKISAWFKSVGDPVDAGDNLFEVETDKTAMEVPSTVGGVIAEIRVSAGETVPVGTVIAVIGQAGAGVAFSPKASIRPTTAAKPTAPKIIAPAVSIAPAPSLARANLAYDPFREVRTPEHNYGRARLPNGAAITPFARRLAAEARIDVSAVRGSGPNGRVVGQDIEASRTAAPSASPLNAPLAGLFDPASFEIVPHNARQRLLAEQVTAAKGFIPHFYIRRDVALDPLLALLEKVDTLDPGLQITLRDCVVKALAIALTRVPDANVRWTDDQSLRFQDADIGVGTDAGGTAVVRAANGKGLRAIAKAAGAAVDSDAFEVGGVSAVWDMSASGVDATAAIVRPPHVTALSIGTVEQRAAVREGEIVSESRSTLTLCCDHRAIDGVVGAELMSACVALLERPMMLIL